MKAAYIHEYGGPEKIIVGELPDPELASNEVLIRVHAASVNPVDWKIREGRLKLFSGKKFPIILGTEIAGEIVQCGSETSGLKSGDRVFAGLSHRGGGYAEFVSAPAKNVFIIPDKLSFEDACTLAVAGMTPLQALRLHYHTKPGDHVLVNGASGGVGTYAVQIAKILGAHVTAVCSERNIELVQSLGADEIIDYNAEDFRLRRNEFDLILDAAANAFFPEVKPCLRKGGMLIKLNLQKKSMLQSLLNIFSSRKIKVILVKNRPKDLQWMIGFILEGSLRVVMDRSFTLDEAEEAQRFSQSGRARGKIVIHCT